MPLFGQTVFLAERKQALSNVMRERAKKRYVAANEVDDSSEGEAPLTKEQRSAEYELAVAARDMGLPKPPLQERVHESPLRVSDSGNRLVSKGPENGPPTTAVGNRIIDMQLMALSAAPGVTAGAADVVCTTPLGTGTTTLTTTTAKTRQGTPRRSAT